MKRLIFIFFLLFIIAGISSYYYFSYNNTNNNAKKSSTKYVKKQEPKVTEGKKLPPVYYDILGKSDNLKKSVADNMIVWRKSVVELAKKSNGSLIINGTTLDKTVCLTFDDGPDDKVMPKILKELHDENVKASFFLIGNKIKYHKNVIKEAFDDGNLILSHAYSHSEMTKFTDSKIKDELISTEDEIFRVIGKRPALIRPPYGDVNERVLDTISRNGYISILWSIDTLDWSKKDPTAISNNVLQNIRPGEIILMHCNEDKEATYEALKIMIPELKKRGYSFLTVAEMLKTNGYK